jgi:hypothetical protein
MVISVLRNYGPYRTHVGAPLEFRRVTKTEKNVHSLSSRFAAREELGWKNQAFLQLKKRGAERESKIPHNATTTKIPFGSIRSDRGHRFAAAPLGMHGRKSRRTILTVRGPLPAKRGGPGVPTSQKIFSPARAA